MAVLKVGEQIPMIIDGRSFTLEYVQRIIDNLELEVGEQSNIKTDEMRQTNVKGLYAGGDITWLLPIGALASAYGGGMAANSIVRGWCD